MTPALVQQAVERAAQQAFLMGLRARRGGSSEAELQAQALQYAVQVVMPKVEVEIEQAVQDAFANWLGFGEEMAEP